MRVFSALALLLLAGGLAAASDKQARQFYDEGQKAERKGQLIQAYLLYSQAAAKDPKNMEYWLHAQGLRVKATLMSEEKLPQSGLGTPAGTALVAEPSGTLEPALEERLGPVALSLPELLPAPERRDLDFRGDARTLFTLVAKLYGLEAEFDADYPSSSAAFPFRLNDAGWKDAIRGLEAATSSFVLPTGERRLLVVKDTAPKRQEREPFISVTIPIPDTVSAQETQDLTNAVRMVAQLTRVGFDMTRRTIVLRDRASVVLPAKALIEQLLRRKTMVSIEIELVEADQSLSSSYGVNIQTSFPLVYFGNLLRSAPTIPTGFVNFLTFGAGKTLFGFGLLDAQVIANMSRATGQTLFQTRLRSLDGQPASLLVGEKYPIVTAKQLLPAGATTSFYPPSFTFEDLGLTVKATPHVHGLDEITLDLDTSFKALTSQVVDEIPVISNRSLQTQVRLKNGEWTVVAGLMDSSQAKSISGLAGLSRVPVLNRVLGQHSRDDSERQVLLLIRPSLLSLPPGETPTTAIPAGAELRPRIPL
jgi:general secretion pathway protein D